MQIIPRIVFSGNCKEGIALYQEYFDATVDYINTYGSVNMSSES